jgi:hypothetical protein
VAVGLSRINKSEPKEKPMVQVQHEMKNVISNLAPAEINNAKQTPFAKVTQSELHERHE